MARAAPVRMTDDTGSTPASPAAASNNSTPWPPTSPRTQSANTPSPIAEHRRAPPPRPAKATAAFSAGPPPVM